jgi:hypothetical protein
MFGYIGIQILTGICWAFSAITFGFGSALAAVIKEKWVCKHTFIEDKQLQFRGNPFMLWIRVILLSIIGMILSSAIIIGGVFIAISIADGISIEQITDLFAAAFDIDAITAEPDAVIDTLMQLGQDLMELLRPIITAVTIVLVVYGLAMYLYSAFVYVNIKKWMVRNTFFAETLQ